jgi:DNA-binding transcriptional LysR family regulator
MIGIPLGYDLVIDLHHLQVFDQIMRQRSRTRAALTLEVTQPALSKTLAKLREYFGDPLFVRVSQRMEPTAKALELECPVREILDRMQALKAAHVPFDPATSRRIFAFSVVDAGAIKLLPPLVTALSREAPGVRVRAVQLEGEHLDLWLESGTIDFAMGALPGLIKGIRRQPLWIESYVSVVRKGHPRLGTRPSLPEFAAERHVLVSTAGTGHAHLQAERALEAAIPTENILCRVPIFIAAAVLAKHTDAIATLPESIATVLADDLGLEIIAPPIRLPRVEICQYWHERFHREPGNQWMRSLFARLFKRSRR